MPRTGREKTGLPGEWPATRGWSALRWVMWKSFVGSFRGSQFRTRMSSPFNTRSSEWATPKFGGDIGCPERHVARAFVILTDAPCRPWFFRGPRPARHTASSSRNAPATAGPRTGGASRKVCIGSFGSTTCPDGPSVVELAHPEVGLEALNRLVKITKARRMALR